jgi:hypothetical protein
MSMTSVRLSVLLFCFPLILVGQDEKPSTSFVIQGEVKASKTFTIADLKKMPASPVGDVVITNHLGEKKSEAKGLKGVLLKDLISQVEINAESPRVLSEYYFVCMANDGYRVVYSWNELFNTSVGESVFIVTEKNGKSIENMQDAILMISSKDQRTGRRHVKALTTIEVKRAR